MWGYPYMVLDADLRSEETHRMRKQISILIGALTMWLIVVIQIVQPIVWWALILNVLLALFITIYYLRVRKTSQ